MVVVVGWSCSVWAVDAQELYNQKCKVCHTLNGVAGPKAKVGGPLDGVGAKHDEAWFRAYFADPKSKIPDSKMKPLKMPQDQIDALVKFMLQQK